MTILMAGFGGRPPLIAATLSALSAVVHKFKGILCSISVALFMVITKVDDVSYR